MLKKTYLGVLISGALALVVGCGSSDNGKVTADSKGGIKLDGGGKKDTGGVKLDKGTTVVADKGTTVVADKGTTVPSAGFGDKCSETVTCKDTTMVCAVTKQGATEGFCTKSCPTLQDQCAGAPAGTMSFCGLTDSASGTNYCVFICAASSQTFPCPTQLKCDTADNPPGSGQKACVP
jgi:hypothetical protein